MSTPKKPDSTGTAAGARNADPRAIPSLTVSRAWLILLAALIIVPWLIAGGIYFRGSREPAIPSEAAHAPVDVKPASTGRGQLTLTPILVSPPLEYVSADWGRTAAPDEWYFPGTSEELLEAFLLSSGLSGEEVARVRSTARPDPRTRGLIVTPDPALIRAMNPRVRTRIYLELAKLSRLDQANAFRFYGPSTEAWLDGSTISPSTRRLVEPMIYRDGEYLLFSDTESIRTQVRDVEELRRLAKTLLRQATMLVSLTIKDASEVAQLAEYWGRGGRRTDLRPLLESVVGAEPDHSIDIVHLLPTFARNHLYRYPRITTADLDKPLLANCLWTALNFFNAQPDDRFLDVNVALSSLRRDYYVVESGYQLGDILAFLDEDGDLFHVAVYLADDLVFSKNGTSPVAPWAITTIDRLKGYYHKRSDKPRLIYHRRNDF